MRRCWLSLTLDLRDPCAYRADGRPDAAHLAFSEHWLSKAPTGPRLGKEDANDPRLLRGICRKHHHALDSGSLRLRREQLPASVEAFARDHKLEARLRYTHGE